MIRPGCLPAGARAIYHSLIGRVERRGAANSRRYGAAGATPNLKANRSPNSGSWHPRFVR